MSETTRIAWTDSTFNPWLGCSRVSEGCRHCYAEQLVQGRMGLERPGTGADALGEIVQEFPASGTAGG